MAGQLHAFSFSAFGQQSLTLNPKPYFGEYVILNMTEHLVGSTRGGFSKSSPYDP